MSSPNNEVSLSVVELKGGWQLSFDPANPLATAQFARADGKFFAVRFCEKKYGQPVLVEKTGPDGLAGVVTPVVKKIDGVWHVLAVSNLRPANDYEEPLLEGARASVSNASPGVSGDLSGFTALPGYGYSNSARISGKIGKSVLDVSDVEYQLPEGASWVDFKQFFDQSTDMMTQAVLGQFLLSR